MSISTVLVRIRSAITNRRTPETSTGIIESKALCDRSVDVDMLKFSIPLIIDTPKKVNLKKSEKKTNMETVSSSDSFVTLSPNSYFDPIKERYNTLSLSLEYIKTVAKIIDVLIQQKLNKPIEGEDEILLREFFGMSNSTWSEEMLATVRRNVSTISIQLALVSLHLKEQGNILEVGLEKIKIHLKNDLDSALKRLIEEERRLIAPTLELAHRTETLIRERMGDGISTCLVLADLLAKDTTTLGNFRGLADTCSVLSPIFSLKPAVNNKLINRLAQGVRVKENDTLTLPSNYIVNIWDAIRVCPEIARELYLRLDLDSEIRRITSTLGAGAKISSTALEMLILWRQDIVTEVLSTYLGGPAYASSAVELHLSLAEVVSGNYSMPSSMPPFIRWSIQQNTLRALGLRDDADRLAAKVKALFGPTQFILRSLNPAKEQLVIPLLELELALPAIISQVLREPLSVLQSTALETNLRAYSVKDQQISTSIAASICKAIQTDRGQLAISQGIELSIPDNFDSQMCNPVIMASALRMVYESVASIVTTPKELNDLSRLLCKLVNNVVDATIEATTDASAHDYKSLLASRITRQRASVSSN
jgi:hypothetical protein